LLEQKILNKYIENKLLPLTSLIKTGLSLNNNSYSRESVPTGISHRPKFCSFDCEIDLPLISLNIVEISDYVMELLLQFVIIYDEIVRTSPDHLSDVMSLIVESVYQVFVDTLRSSTAENISLWNRIQVNIRIDSLNDVCACVSVPFPNIIQPISFVVIV
jgi:hypothetical protein